jgi:hypothetical protein
MDSFMYLFALFEFGSDFIVRVGLDTNIQKKRRIGLAEIEPRLISPIESIPQALNSGVPVFRTPS